MKTCLQEDKIKAERVKNINKAFKRLSKQIEKYLAICYINGYPLKSFVMRGSKDGNHVRTSIRYHKI